MATPELLQKWKLALHIERELQTQLKKDLPLFEDVDNLIHEMRIACEATIFLDFEYATKEEVENHLWDAHSFINKRYRKMVGHYRSGDQKKHVVERRKLEKRYADFIKTSQFFYKGYIQRLASHFAGMKGLRRVAHRLSLSPLSVDDRVKVSQQVEHLIELSCHATLLRLGDLSRYRNDLRTKDRSWEPALAYYSLASDLYPDSGSSHNQMAVIALADGNHLDALYHLYRAIAVKEPHPLAKGNLEIDFKKITTAWEKGPHVKADSEATLILWFVRLHAKFYKGAEFSTHEELENEVLYRLDLLLKEQSFDTTLEKFVLINIAAEYLAGERFKEQGPDATSEPFQSFCFFLRLNVRMLSVLLQVIHSELEDQATGDDLPNGTGSQSNSSRDKITAIMRRVLPALRQYSAWLVSRARIIVAPVGVGAISIQHIREMWTTYADVLTRLANLFPPEYRITVNYLLEEDQTTIGFKPLRDPDVATERNLYTNECGVLKPRVTDPGVERNHPNIEMSARVNDIVLYGQSLHNIAECPISFNGANVFSYVENLSATGPAANDQLQSSSLPSPIRASNHFTIPESASLESSEAVTDECVTVSDSHQSLDTDMHRMVDRLLEPPSGSGRYDNCNETSYGMHSLTANEIFAPLGTNSFQTRHQSTPKILPSLPGIWNSAFTPQPNELQPTSPDRPIPPTRDFSPLRLATVAQQRSAAEALDEVTGHGKSKYNSWGRNSSRPAAVTTSQPVNQILQDTLTQQFMPASMPSSGFSDSSSIYVNTPNLQRNGATSRNDPFPKSHADASDYDNSTMLRSSIWNNGQPAWSENVRTPPSGQGG